jgi:hypothetical protein
MEIESVKSKSNANMKARTATDLDAQNDQKGEFTQADLIGSACSLSLSSVCRVYEATGTNVRS